MLAGEGADRICGQQTCLWTA
ncbi:MAG: hypothetical protein QOJ50_3897, partial [Cryptosporangiaceae bacterium]|nr:hypothetical protein [Cryptosporangiaceae bacterium]